MNYLFWLDLPKHKTKTSIFDKNPSRKISLLWSKISISLLWSKKRSFLSRILTEHLFWLTQDKNFDFLDLFKTSLFCLKSILFYPEYQQTTFSGLICAPAPSRPPKKDTRQIWFFDKNHGLTPLKNFRFFGVFKNNSLFWWKKKTFFSFQSIRKQSFLAWFTQKTHKIEVSIFWQKPWTNPFKTFWFFLLVLQLHLSGQKSMLFYPEYPKTIFSD